jgi:hypothetical protein
VPTLREERERVKWLIREGKVGDEEPCKVVFPRLEAKKRAANKEKRCRVAFDTDPASYQDFHEQKERYIRLCNDNKTLGIHAMIAVLTAFTDEQVQALRDAGE